MKKEIKGFVLGVLTTVVIGSGAAIAAGQFVSIDVVPNNVTIALNGQATNIPSFTYNDSTYVQLRPVLEGISCEVEWHPESQVVNAYNSYMIMSPAYINDIGRIYDIVSWSPTTYESDSIKAYIDIEVLRDLGFNFLPDSLDDFGYYVYWRNPV